VRSFSCGMQDLLVWHVGFLLLHVDSISSSMLDLLLVACKACEIFLLWYVGSLLWYVGSL